MIVLVVKVGLYSGSENVMMVVESGGFVDLVYLVDLSLVLD